MKFLISQIVAMVAAVAFWRWTGALSGTIFIWCVIQVFYVGVDQICDHIDGM